MTTLKKRAFNEQRYVGKHMYYFSIEVFLVWYSFIQVLSTTRAHLRRIIHLALNINIFKNFSFVQIRIKIYT